MTIDRWARIERIYHAALEQPACDRAAFVRSEADGGVELVAEIEALLAYDDRPAAFMQHSAMELAARTLAAQADPRESGVSFGTIGSYEILRPLGAGGMGDVYLARDTRLVRNTALKMLRADLGDPDWIAAFRHEAMSTSSRASRAGRWEEHLRPHLQLRLVSASWCGATGACHQVGSHVRRQGLRRSDSQRSLLAADRS